MRRRDSDYMVRAERRPGGYGASTIEPKKVRKPKKHIVYGIFTVLFLAVLWPVGLIMLWVPHLRWNAAGKLATTIITFFVFMSLLGIALNAPTDNVQIQAAQQKGLEIMDVVQQGTTVLLDDFLDNSDKAVANIQESFSLAMNVGTEKVIEAAEWVNDRAHDANDGVKTVRHMIDGTTAEPTAEPTEAPTPTPEATPAPTATPTPRPLAKIQSPAEATVYHTANGRNYHMTANCKNMSGAAADTLAAAIAAGFTPCAECGAPAETVLAVDTKLLWADESDLYHTTSECEQFNGKYRLMSLEDCFEAGLTPCAACNATDYIYRAPDDLLGGEDAPELTNVTDAPAETPVPAAPGAATPVPTEAPTAEPTEAPAVTDEPTETAAATEAAATDAPEAAETEAPTAEPTAAPTELSADATTMPMATLKPAGEAMVWHTTNGGWYHTEANCSGMTSATQYTLASSVEKNLKPCKRCNAPLPEILEAEYVVWVDENNTFHTADECEFFTGKYTLMPLADAIEQGMTACMDCGASEYVPLVQRAADATAEPTVTDVPQAELTEEQRMELAKEITVFYSNGSRFYHISGQCGTMKHGSEHTLYEALTTKHEWCPVCQPIKLEDMH